MEQVIVQNVNVPGYERFVDAHRYRSMRRALREVLPEEAPGLTQAEMLAAVAGRLPEALFSGAEQAGWWLKTVMADLEAKGLLEREPTRPVRWHRAAAF